MARPDHFTRINWFSYGCSDCKHKSGRRCTLHKITVFSESFCEDQHIYKWSNSPEYAGLDDDSSLEQIETARKAYESRIKEQEA